MNDLTTALERILKSLESGHSSLESFQGWLDSCRRPHEQTTYAERVVLLIAQKLADEAQYRIESKDWDPTSYNGPGPFL